jgi:hypothetical protein
MNTHADQTVENKSKSVASSAAQMQTSGEATFEFVDSRPESIAQRKLQNMANNSSQAKQAAQLQATADTYSAQQHPTVQRQENNTGLPDNLKSGMENLSGLSMDDVKVHRNSDKPAQLQAHAYAQGTDIHLASGQEKHLPHEAWHVVQQKQGRVKPTMQMKGNVNVNDDKGLEREADVMGAKAMSNMHSIQREKHQKSPSTSDFGSFQRVALNTDDIVQRAIISIGDVNKKTKLRERPKNDSLTRGNNIEVGKNVLKVDDSTAVIDDESGSEHKWLDVDVIAGEQIGFSGYLHYEKYRAASSQINDNLLGYVTASAKLRESPTVEKTGTSLSPGDLFYVKEEASEEVPFAKVWIGIGNGRNHTGWLREGKMMMRKDPLVPDIYEVEKLTASEARTAPETLGVAPIVDTEETSKEELLEALEDLGRKQSFFEYEIEQGGKPAGSVAAAMEKVELFFTSEAAAKQRLRKDNVTAIAQQKAQSEADDLYFKLLDKTRGLKQAIHQANYILNQDLSQSSIEEIETATFLQVGRTKYSAALKVYSAIKETYEKLISDDASINPIIKETVELAKEESEAKESRLKLGGELLGYTGESIADATSEGGEASLSGLYGERTTQGAHTTESGGSDARIVSALDQYDDEQNLIDKQERQGYNSLDSGAIALGSERYKGFADDMSKVVQDSAGWLKALGFLQDLSVTPQGISATVKKLSIIKPFPPLASALISIPLYPGVGVKLEAKAKASVSLSAGISINWGDWLTSGKKSQADIDTLYNKQKTGLGKKQLLQNKLRDGSPAEKEKASEDYQVVGKELQAITASISKQQKQLSMWSRDMTLQVKGTGNANASIDGEFFGGIFLGIPVLNVSGGLYGEIGASAKANIGIDGTFERKDGDWYKSANLTFDLNGGLNAEVGAKANYQILFFSGDIAKFTFGEWNIASFFVRGKKGLGSKADPLTNPDGIEKKVMWFKGAPPIETRVEESKDKATSSVKVVSDEIGDKLSAEQNTDFEKIHTSVESGGAAEGMAAQLASLKQKKETLAIMTEAGQELPRGAVISETKMAEMVQLEVEIRDLKGSLASARDEQDADLTELSKLLAVLEEKHGSKFSKKHTLSESAEKEVGSFRTLSDTYFNQAQKKTFSLSRQLVVHKRKFDDAKDALDLFVSFNQRTVVKDYMDLETLVHKKEDIIGTQKQTIKDLELQKSGIKNQKKKSSEDGGAEAEREKQRTLQRIDVSLTEEKAKLAAHKRVLKDLKDQKTKARKMDKTNVGKYKTYRNDLRAVKNQYESIIEEIERINTQMLKARSFAEEANVLDAQLKEYTEKIAEVKKYKELMENLQNIESF